MRHGRAPLSFSPLLEYEIAFDPVCSLVFEDETRVRVSRESVGRCESPLAAALHLSSARPVQAIYRRGDRSRVDMTQDNLNALWLCTRDSFLRRSNTNYN